MKVKNRLIKIALHLWKKIFRSYEVNAEDPRYLVVSTTGLGDTLWGTPAIKSLKKEQPNAYIAVLTTALGQEIFQSNPYVNQVCVLKKSLFSTLKLLIKLRTASLQTALIFHTSQRLAIPLCIFGGVSRVIGSEKINKELDFLLTDSLPLENIHEIERRLNIVSRTSHQNKAPVQTSKHLELFLSFEEEQEADRFLKKYSIPPYVPLVAIHAGAKDGFKHWPPSLYIDLAVRLKNHLGCHILLTGTPSEQILLEHLSRALPDAIICKDLPLRPFSALLKKLKLFITNDTGPMHLAFAMNTPTVALFGPTDPKLCGPYLATNVAIIKKRSTCTPCLKKKCLEPFCMLQISPEEVFQTALKLFYAQGANYYGHSY